MTKKLILVALFFLILAGCTWSPHHTAMEKALSPTAGDQEATTRPPSGKEPEPSTSSTRDGKSPVPASIPRAEAQETTAGNVYQPTGKVAYLTFDDGPNRFFTPRVLDILAKYKVKATFMVVGKNVEQNKELIQRIIAAGHGLANHSYSHDYKKIYRSPDAFLADLQACSDVLQEFTGEPVKIFRAPGGPENLSKPLREKLRQSGYHSVGWNVVGGDTDSRGATTDQIYWNVINGVSRIEKIHRSPIILLHDGADLSTLEVPANSPTGRYIQTRQHLIEALPKIIETLQSEGYQFAVVDENTPPAW
ncbi:MAG: polysaccharide deacetylase [Thermoanaerobacteraceae bacterium]|nr:polysaccharide deacetylase [Thermoanaerobacteraceae bacterium]